MAPSAERKSSIHRQTKETDINLSFHLDGQGNASIQTGVPFMDHMLTLFAVHGFFDLEVTASGDTEVDDHHTVEDLGICLGQALKEALGNFSSICRYGQGAVDENAAVAVSQEPSPSLQGLNAAAQAVSGAFHDLDPSICSKSGFVQLDWLWPGSTAVRAALTGWSYWRSYPGLRHRTPGTVRPGD